ncbi:mitochondrial import receptor protein [Ptychographa xylographoides]|nr:mitochondrial import receptor protein [Ptychographa xylographoides]
MVQLEEVEDEEFDRVQVGEKDFNDDDDFTDTDSEISDDEIVATTSESLGDRILALQDMVPPSARRRIAYGFDTVKSWGWSGLMLGGKTMWVVSTSALLLGVPFALALVEEQQVVEMEKEQRMREMGNELITPGATGGGQQQGRPAL